MDKSLDTIDRLLQLLDNPLCVFDIGCRGGFQERWNQFRSNIELIGFDADRAAIETLEKSEGVPNEQVVARALGAERGQRTFYNTKTPACSSLFYPDQELEKDRPILFPDINVASTSPVEIMTLDEYGAANGISRIDFLKLDVQGAELDILKGSQKLLKTVRAVEAEVEFNPIYEGQPLFGDIDHFLRTQGFCLWRLSNLQHYGLPGNLSLYNTKEVANFDTQSAQFVGRGGQLYWADAFYVREEIAFTKGSRNWQTKLRDACIAMILGFEDLAKKTIAEILEICPADIGKKLIEMKGLVLLNTRLPAISWDLKQMVQEIGSGVGIMEFFP